MRVEDLSRAAITLLVLCGMSGGAAAWQRPKAQAPAKAATCPELGEGFVRIAGSDTCVRVGGSVRVEALHLGGGSALFPVER